MSYYELHLFQFRSAQAEISRSMYDLQQSLTEIRKMNQILVCEQGAQVEKIRKKINDFQKLAERQHRNTGYLYTTIDRIVEITLETDRAAKGKSWQGGDTARCLPNIPEISNLPVIDGVNQEEWVQTMMGLGLGISGIQTLTNMFWGIRGTGEGAKEVAGWLENLPEDGLEILRQSAEKYPTQLAKKGLKESLLYFAKTVGPNSLVGKLAIGYAKVGIPIAGGIENFRTGLMEGESVGESAKDALITTGAGLVGGVVGGKVGLVLGNAIPIPVVGAVTGAIVGTVVGTVIGVGIDYFATNFVDSPGVKNFVDGSIKNITEAANEIGKAFENTGKAIGSLFGF